MERGEAFSKTWRTTHGDLTDEEWELIGDLVAPTPERDGSAARSETTVGRS